MGFVIPAVFLVLLLFALAHPSGPAEKDDEVTRTNAAEEAAAGTARIDDRRATFAADHVGKMGETLALDRFEKHTASADGLRFDLDDSTQNSESTS